VPSRGHAALVHLLASVAHGTRVTPPSSPDAFRDLVETASAAGLAPAVAFALREAPTPAEIAASLRASVAAARARNAIASRDLAQIVDGLRGAGVDAMPLKGPALADWLYPDPTLRPFSDLDLLVRGDDVVRADELLRSLGYTRGLATDAHDWAFDVAWDGETLYDRKDGARVDLHWRLINGARYAWDTAAASAVWERAIEIEVANRRMPSLCPEDLCLYLALHLAVPHAGVGLVWQWDIALLLARYGAAMDWDAVTSEAARWRVRRAVGFGLATVAGTFGIEVPDHAMRSLAGRGAGRRVARWLADDARRPLRARLEPIAPIALADDARGAAHALRQALWPDAAWMRARYGAGRSWGRRYVDHYRRATRVVLAMAGRRR
jgi:hypothetical protein